MHHRDVLPLDFLRLGFRLVMLPRVSRDKRNGLDLVAGSECGVLMAGLLACVLVDERAVLTLCLLYTSDAADE